MVTPARQGLPTTDKLRRATEDWQEELCPVRVRSPHFRPEAPVNEDDIFKVLQITGGQRRPRIVTETFSDTSIKFPVRNVNAVQIEEVGVRRENRRVPQALKHHVLKAPHAAFTKIQ